MKLTKLMFDGRIVNFHLHTQKMTIQTIYWSLQNK